MKRFAFVAVAFSLALLVFGACRDVTEPTGPRSPRYSPSAASVAGGSFAYVTNFFSASVSVIDLATNTIVGSPIPVGNGPIGIAITPDGITAYVANAGFRTVSVIDLASNTVVGSPITVGSNPRTIAITPDGTRAYVANQGSHNVSVIDLATNTVVGSPIPVGNGPIGIAITPDGTRAYVANLSSANVSVIDVASNTVVGSILVGTNPFAVAITPDGTTAYVANSGFPYTVSVIDVATNTVVGTPITVGQLPLDIAITPDGSTAYVVNHSSANVSVIDVATSTVVGSPIPVGSFPFAIAITPDGATAYVADEVLNNVSVIDLATNTVVGSPIPVESRPRGIAITPSLLPPDDQAPVTTAVTADPNPVAVGSNVDLTANVDDTNTGGSNIGSAEYSLDGGSTWSPMGATDGVFDEVAEDVQASFYAPAEAGIYDLCVRGTDGLGNVGGPECIMLVVYDPTGGFVTGGGWIDSPAGAYVADPGLTGKANFGFVSKYKKGATVPTGNTEFQFKAGDLDFHSSSYEFLVVTMGGTNAQFKGSGTVNGGPAPTGTEFKFMLWARDGSPETFRIKIWSENGGEVLVYDNAFDQPIGGGSIVVHTK